MLNQTRPPAPPAGGTQATPAAAPAAVRPLPQILVIAAAALVITGQLYLALPLLAPIAADTGASTATVSWTVTAFGAAYALGFLVFGPLVPRIGHRRLIAAGLAATALFAVVTALMPTAETVIAARALQGCAAATFAPTAIGYLTRTIPASRRAHAFTALTSAFLASAVVAQVAAQVIADRWGWPAAFLASGAVTAGVAVLARLVLVPDGRDRATPLAAAYRGLLTAALLPRLLPFYLVALTLLFGFVGVYAAVRPTDPLGVAGDAAALLTLRATGLPAILLAPLAMPLLARLAPPHRLAASAAAAALLIGAAAASVPLAGSVALFTLLLGGFVFATAVALPAAMQATTAAAGDHLAGASAMYGFWLYIGSSAAAPVVAGTVGLGFTGLGAMFAAVLLAGSAAALGAVFLGRRAAR
ncbi:MFS transporter [Streptomonospora sp. S1-112]|uniref:MFS transporter n=1 Tax=Streptomonospora mangrovi TaxID=2883123 RepID=A0A9X3NIV5_9ACTN|nr:MFS transporter [Streptomonospora mangrovi]MDA0562846.1 MFS transporter [Streptomonospora mangrovi]